VVRGVDAGGIVGRVGVDSAAEEVEFDACVSREAEVRPFADDAHTQFGRVDTDCVVHAVPRHGVILPARLHVCADATEPHKIGGRAEDRLHEIGRRKRPLRKIKETLYLLGKCDRLRVALEHGAARREELEGIAVPVQAVVEHPPALGEAARRIGIGVDEDVRVVERADQFDVR
jgi:hypothetical protein